LAHPEEKTFNLHEVFFDQLYFRWDRPLGIPMTFTLGRQNIMLGEGFLVMDGHPLDGSRSIYFNAARLGFLLSKERQLILFYTYQPVQDTWLPVIHDQDQALIEQPEEGIGIYYTGKHRGIQLDGYAIRKNIMRGDGDASSAASRINTIGGRIAFPIGGTLAFTAEGAVQFGTFGQQDRSSWGGYGYFDYRMGRSPFLPRMLRIGGIALSGDDADTDRLEGWDPLFSRWPKWSESFIWTQIVEYGGKIAYWSNFMSTYGSLHFRPLSSLDLSLVYYRVFSMHSPVEDGFPGGDGKTRGDLIIAKATFQLTRTLSGHLLFETLIPGNFYFDGADVYRWFRLELMYRTVFFGS
jgi:hypothetical protein